MYIAFTHLFASVRRCVALWAEKKQISPGRSRRESKIPYVLSGSLRRTRIACRKTASFIPTISTCWSRNARLLLYQTQCRSSNGIFTFFMQFRDIFITFLLYTFPFLNTIKTVVFWGIFFIFAGGSERLLTNKKETVP